MNDTADALILAFDPASSDGDKSVLALVDYSGIEARIRAVYTLPLDMMQSDELRSSLTEYRYKTQMHIDAARPGAASFMSSLRDYQRQAYASMYRMLRPVRKRGKHTKHGGYTWIRT